MVCGGCVVIGEGNGGDIIDGGGCVVAGDGCGVDIIDGGGSVDAGDGSGGNLDIDADAAFECVRLLSNSLSSCVSGTMTDGSAASSSPLSVASLSYSNDSLLIARESSSREVLAAFGRDDVEGDGE
jgi:hypothetical protein